jgi:hypothetical protein
MLLSVAIVAVTVVVTRDYVRVQSAREQFDWLCATWEAGRASTETIVGGSYRLMNAEQSALWLSKRTAEARHVKRLEWILDKVQSPLSEASPDTIKRRASSILDEIRRYDPGAANARSKNQSNQSPSLP